MNWAPIERERARVKTSGSDFQPSAFTMFAFAATHALKEHSAFRTTLVGDSTLRTYDHVALGIAVGLPGDALVLAVVPDADTLDWQSFAARMRERIDVARAGTDQATEAVTVSLTNMQSFGLRDAVPVVVAPAVATLFLGEVYTGIDQSSDELRPARLVNVAMTFDHRLVNGVGAANFVNAVKKHVETISGLVGGTP
jgi:pyruvate dehydrogenase E2 component (dihydrolipoamide acetyltransferase)